MNEPAADSSEVVRVVDYRPEHFDDFRRLNYAWIDHYFEIEGPDREALENPERKILEPGGAILIAELGAEVVGTCALMRRDAETFELAKMCVSEHLRGRRIGWQLGRAAIERARERGVASIYLESNSSLVPALKLYERLGFQHVSGSATPYARCDVFMRLMLRE